MMRNAIATLSTLVLFTLLGCSGLPSVGGVTDAVADPELAARLSQINYPGGEEALGDDVNLVATQSGRTLRLRNFEAQRFDNVQIWVNQQYVSDKTSIAIGQDNRFDLADFINKHGEPFPTGSFLSPDKAKRLVLIEIYSPETGKRHRMVIQENRKPFF